MKEKIKNILRYLDKIFVFLAENFLFSIFLVVSSVIFLTNIFFYKYYILSEEIMSKSKTEQKQIIIDEKNHNELLKIWEEQDKKFQNSNSKNYVNIFKAR